MTIWRRDWKQKKKKKRKGDVIPFKRFLKKISIRNVNLG